MRRSFSHSILPLAFMLLTGGCKNSKLGGTLSWRTQTFVRVPSSLPVGYSDRGNSVVKAHGWTFRHVAGCPLKEGPEAHWWMASPDDPSRLKLGNASWFKMLFTGTAIRYSDWKKIAAVTPEIADACLEAFHAYPQMVEPDLIFKSEAQKADIERIFEQKQRQSDNLAAKGKPGVLELNALHLPGWAKGPSDRPPYDPLWHQMDDYTQLATAKHRVRAATGSAGGGIRIGLLDVGYNMDHLLVPRNTIGRDGQPGGGDRGGEHLGDAISSLYCADGSCALVRPGETNGEHGMKAMSLLAGPARTLTDPRAGKKGSKVRADRLAPNEIEIGGAPDAVIVPARVAPWIFSHSTANLAYAIDYASRVQRCDVISMSHGGTPSPMWIDAVNAAYERGTAIFAACGDYFNAPPFELGIVAPSATVYPAACRRVQSVAGLTANGEPYGSSDIRHYPLFFLLPWHWFPMRGSFGADQAHRDWMHTSLNTMIKRTDRTEARRGGLMRTQPISTWTPNTASAQPPGEKNGFKPNLFNMNWDGTSAATPQAAAAAALWLAMHRTELEKAGFWRDWHKAEAVYVAMLKSSGGLKPGDSGVPLDMRMPDLHCGAGSLKASDMLDVSLRDAMSTHVSADALKNKLPEGTDIADILKFPDKRMARDFYDGQRSGAAILGWETTFCPVRQRADALTDEFHRLTIDRQKQRALEIIYYNQRLVQQWNIGRLPRRDYEEDAKEPPAVAQEHGRLAPRKNWLARYFSPDSPDIKEEARAMAARGTPAP